MTPHRYLLCISINATLSPQQQSRCVPQRQPFDPSAERTLINYKKTASAFTVRGFSNQLETRRKNLLNDSIAYIHMCKSSRMSHTMWGKHMATANHNTKQGQTYVQRELPGKAGASVRAQGRAGTIKRRLELSEWLWAVVCFYC